MKKTQLKDVELSLAELQQRKKVKCSIYIQNIIRMVCTEVSLLPTFFGIYIPACLAGIRATDCRDGKDGEGEKDCGVCSKRQQDREGLCQV